MLHAILYTALPDNTHAFGNSIFRQKEKAVYEAELQNILFLLMNEDSSHQLLA